MAYFATGPVTAVQLEAIVPKIKRKSADETVNNTATLQADDELIGALIASTHYVFELVCHYISGTTPDFKIAWSLPTGGTNVFAFDVFDTALVRTLAGGQTTVPTTGVAVGGTGGNTVAKFWGTVSTSTTAGNMQVSFAQNTANASNSSMLAGSYLMLQQVVST